MLRNASLTAMMTGVLLFRTLLQVGCVGRGPAEDVAKQAIKQLKKAHVLK